MYPNDHHLPEPGSGSRAVPPAADRTRVFPTVAGPGGDPEYPGQVSPAEPMSGSPYQVGSGSGYATPTARGNYSAEHSAPGYGTGYTASDHHHADYTGRRPAAGGTTGYGATYPGTGRRSRASRRGESGRGRLGGRGLAVPSDLRIGLGSALTAGGGLLVLLFSVTPFIRYDNPGGVQRLAGKQIGLSFSAWSTETFLAPLTWLACLATLALVALTVLRVLTSKEREFFGFQIGQVQVGLSLFGFLVLVGYALSGKGLVFGSELNDAVTARFAAGDVSLTLGGGMMVIGSLVAVVGAFLDHLEIGPTVWPPTEKPSGRQAGRPGGYRYEPPAGGYPQQGGYPDPYQPGAGNYRM